MAETDLFNLGDTSGENSSFQELANQAAPSGGNPIVSEEEGTPLPPPQKVSQPVLDALSRPQDPTQLLHEDIHVNSILDVKETLNERLNRMSSPHFEADFGDKDLSREDFFPTIDRKILAGQSTNEFVGTQPIFVGEGALFPFAIQQSRQKALSKAAEKRAEVRKKVRKLTEMHAVAQYDEEFQGMVSGLLEEFGEKSGWKLEDLADSRNEMGREFFRKLNKLKVLRNDLTAADAKAREVRETFTDPKTFTPESVLESTRKIIAGQGDLEGMLNSKKKRAEFYEGVSKLTSYENATKFLDSRFEGTKIGEDISSELERSLAEILEGTDKDLQNSIISKWASEESDQVIEVIKEIIPKGRVEDLVRTAIKHSNVYKGEDLKTDAEREAIIQEYIDYTYNKLGQKLKTKVTFPKVRAEKDDDSGGSKTKKDDTTLFGGAMNGAKKHQEDIGSKVKTANRLMATGDTQGASHAISQASSDHLGFTFQNVDLDEISYGKAKSLENGRINQLSTLDDSNKIEVFIDGKQKLVTTSEWAKSLASEADPTIEESNYFEQLTGTPLLNITTNDKGEVLSKEKANINIDNIQIKQGNIFDNTGGFGNLVESGVVWGKKVGNDFIPVTNAEISALGGTSSLQLLAYNKMSPMIESFGGAGTNAQVINTVPSNSGLGAVYNFVPLRTQADVATMNSTIVKTNAQLIKEDTSEETRKERLAAEQEAKNSKKKKKKLPKKTN